MLPILALPLAFAAGPDEPAEEVIVYGDDFARWDHTRWLLQSELILPLGMDLASDVNKSFTTYGFQVRAIVACEKDVKLSKRKWEVSCAIEDVGLRVTSQDRWRRERDREIVQSVLDDLDARMTGARVQMQVDEEGGITNFDIEGMDSDNLRERKIQETTRQLMSRVMSGFHLRIPDHAQRNGTWAEYHSELFDLPSLTSSRGSSLMVHGVAPYEGGKLRIVQTRGEGLTVVALPIGGGDPFSPPPPEVEGGGSSGGPAGIGAASMSAPAMVSGGGPSGKVMSEGESGMDASFAMVVQGVAVFETATGIMTERVWTCFGTPTAGSARNVGAYRNVGRIRLLGETERPDVGGTVQVAWPTPVRAMEGLAPWVSIEEMPDAAAVAPAADAPG